MAALQVQHRRTRAGRPQTNGHVERAQGAVPEACRNPTFARAPVPTSTALRLDPDRDVRSSKHRFREQRDSRLRASVAHERRVIAEVRPVERDG